MRRESGSGARSPRTRVERPVSAHVPGSRISIVTEEHLRRDRPDRVVILPWNLREEVVEQLAYIRDWGGQCVLPIPTLAVLD
jgi:hypothetical protein